MLRFIPTGPQPFVLEVHGRVLNGVVRAGDGLSSEPGRPEGDGFGDDEGRERGCSDALVWVGDGEPDAGREAVAEPLGRALGGGSGVVADG
ncbi:hypothetical protein ACGF4C_19735 [Streptomyces sp. NPDC048197]|uniref:hypothetical protein n=1 Tax=Streptomyces sp. NPDC048197 TaxID=3365511 RepID=UPI00371A2E71